MADPLHSLHEQANAEFQPYGAVQIVSTFGIPQAEYAAIHKACGMMDLPQRSVIEVTGKDRLNFLNNLLTNQIIDKQSKASLPAGRGVYAFLLNAKTGRIIVDVNVLELGEQTFLELDGRLIETVLPILERYRFAEQVQFRSRQDDLHEIALYGPRAMGILKEAADGAPGLDVPLACGAARIIGQDVTVWRDDPCGVLGLHLIVPVQSVEAIWSHLLTRFGGQLWNPSPSPSPGTPGEGGGEGLSSIANRQSQIANPEDGPHPNPLPAYRERGQELGKRELRPIGWAAFNACRIEAGRPIFGIDFDDSILPAETGQLARAVSFTKGCYPGQEVVARMHARQQIARQIVGMKMESDALPIAGAPIFEHKDSEAGNAIGGVTSSTISPILSNAALCLGLVKRPFFAVGTKLMIPAEGAMRSATVVETPFVNH